MNMGLHNNSLDLQYRQVSLHQDDPRLNTAGLDLYSTSIKVRSWEQQCDSAACASPVDQVNAPYRMDCSSVVIFTIAICLYDACRMVAWIFPSTMKRSGVIKLR